MANPARKPIHQPRGCRAESTTLPMASIRFRAARVLETLAAGELAEAVGRLAPAEVVLPTELELRLEDGVLRTPRDKWEFDPELARAELARRTGLSKPTVSLALTNLERSGLVRASGVRTGARVAERPRACTGDRSRHRRREPS